MQVYRDRESISNPKYFQALIAYKKNQPLSVFYELSGMSPVHTLLHSLKARSNGAQVDLGTLHANPEFFKKFLEWGQYWHNDKVDRLPDISPDTYIEMAVETWSRDKANHVLVVGVALKNNLWRPHAWVIKVKPRVNRLIEPSTLVYDDYFGYGMTPDEAELFVFHTRGGRVNRG